MIRRARKSDKADVGRLWIELLRMQAELDNRFAPSDDAEMRWRNDFAGWLESSSRRIFVAEDAGRLCGFITAERWHPQPIYTENPGIYIDELYVEADYRRRGHATQLVRAIRDWGEEIGALQLRAGVLTGNDVGAAFWRRVGGEAIVQTFSIQIRPKQAETAARRRIGFQL